MHNPGTDNFGGAARRVAALFFYCAAASIAFVGPSRGEVDFFREVQPLLSEHCSECHGGVKRKGGINFSNRHDAFAEAESGGIAIVPGDLEKSELVHRVSTDDEDDRMPPAEPLAPGEVDILKRWIAEGAEWPRHWALQPNEKTDHPEVADTSWPRNAIDRHVLARLEAEGIRPSPEAARHTLIRRLALDLTGLLPAPAEIEAFLNDTSPGAYEKIVDRYLASPHFGERWGRHWLDEARYADSAGYEKDSPRSDAYRWRDWVIDAVNDDMPFDEFTVKQIAGDLVPNASKEDRIATAFHLMTQFNLEGGVDAEEDRIKRVINRVNTIGSVWLAATVECCQCHDHPYDPVKARDYYAMLAFFNNADYDAIFAGDAPEDAEDRIAKRNEKWEPLSKLLDEIVTNNDLSVTIQGQLTKLRQFDNANGFTRVMSERTKNRRKQYVFRRGDFLQPLVEEGEVLPGTPEAWPSLQSRGEGDVADRLDFAAWLVDPEMPFVGRVTANKVWLHLFGAALAPIPQDFGARGAPPSHPELLDWLAGYFVDDAAWSRKKLIRKIVTSATYRQASHHRPELADVDSDNRLLARQNRFRVQAETVRDVHLQASGLLSRKVGGPSVFPPIPADVAAQSYANNFKWKTSEGEDRYRRGIYTFYKRTAPDPNLVTFDCPDSSMSKQMRDSSNSPLQALATLQNEVFVEAARSFAKTLVECDTADDAGRIEIAFLRAVGRRPVAAEEDTVRKLLAESRSFYRENTGAATELIGAYGSEKAAPHETAAWVATGRVILNLDEFITRE